MRLTWDGVGKSVGVFGYECVLNVSSADSMGTCQRQTQSVTEVSSKGRLESGFGRWFSFPSSKNIRIHEAPLLMNLVLSIQTLIVTYFLRAKRHPSVTS